MIMKSSVAAGHLCAVVFSAAALLGGCGLPGTTTDGFQSISDGVGTTLNSMTDVSSSTSSDSTKTAFINDRFQAIRFEAAKGEGENVEALAVLLGEQDRKAFARWMQTNYQPLFAGLTKPDELLARIQQRRGVVSG